MVESRSSKALRVQPSDTGSAAEPHGTQSSEDHLPQYATMDVTARLVIPPLAVAALLTGIIQPIGTPWGLFAVFSTLRSHSETNACCCGLSRVADRPQRESDMNAAIARLLPRASATSVANFEHLGLAAVSLHAGAGQIQRNFSEGYHSHRWCPWNGWRLSRVWGKFVLPLSRGHVLDLIPSANPGRDRPRMGLIHAIDLPATWERLPDR